MQRYQSVLSRHGDEDRVGASPESPRIKEDTKIEIQVRQSAPLRLEDQDIDSLRSPTDSESEEEATPTISAKSVESEGEKLIVPTLPKVI